MKRFFLFLLSVLISFFLGSVQAEAQKNDPWSYRGPQYGQKHYSEKHEDALSAYITWASEDGYLRRDDLPRYKAALSELPFRRDILPYLSKKDPKDLRMSLESLSRKKCTFIGPFVFYAQIRNYDQLLIRHVDLRPVIEKIRRHSLRPDVDG